MRLLCDEMLRGLARWLRAAGHDTALAEGGHADCALIARASGEGRVLLTRDRRLAAAAEGRARVLLLAADGIDAQARELSQSLAVDWREAPFTICLVDNTPLTPAPPALAAQLPQRARELGGPVRFCPRCRRLYWPGSHVRRMQARLARWAAPAAQANGSATRGQ